MEAKVTALLILDLIISDLTLSLCHHDELPLSVVILFTFSRSLILFGSLYVSTFMVIRKNTVHSNPNRVALAHLAGALEINSNTMTRSKSPSSDDSAGSFSFKVTMLDQILMNPMALNLFMLHLQKEYSMELLLSYIEIDQFQKHVNKTATDILRTFACGDDDLADLPDGSSPTPTGPMDMR